MPTICSHVTVAATCGVNNMLASNLEAHRTFEGSQGVRVTPSNFSELCISLCLSAGVPVPNLEPDAAGNTVLVVAVNGVEILVSYEPRNAPANVKLDASLGVLAPQDVACASSALAIIRSAMHWHRRALFVRDEGSGTVVFECIYPLSSASG